MTSAKSFVRAPPNYRGNYRAILKIFLIHAHIMTHTQWEDNGTLRDNFKPTSAVISVSEGLRSSDDDFIDETPVAKR